MKKIFYLIALVAVCFLFVQCEQNELNQDYGKHNGHEYVDLGLSVKWATCNVGANSPEEYGDHFAWGEVKPKYYYHWNTYKYYYELNNNFTKYTSRDQIVLDIKDDVACVNWGGMWRMPTKAEQTELVNNCTWTWSTQNGVNGYKVTGINKNSIFLPAACFMVADSLCLVGRGGYWSTYLKPDTLQDATAYFLYFNSDTMGVTYYPRSVGLSVRPVCQ